MLNDWDCDQDCIYVGVVVHLEEERKGRSGMDSVLKETVESVADSSRCAAVTTVALARGFWIFIAQRQG